MVVPPTANCLGCAERMPSGRGHAIDCPNREDVECLDAHKGGCRGTVEFRPSLTGTGMAIPRCDKHWSDRLDFQAEHERIYPDSDIPPAWFDPEAAGERWNEED